MSTYVYYGSTTGIDSSTEYMIVPREFDPDASADLGRMSGPAGDVDVDGYDDLHVRQYLFMGGPDGVSTASVRQLETLTASKVTGVASGRGDYDADGWEDLAAPHTSSGQPRTLSIFLGVCDDEDEDGWCATAECNDDDPHDVSGPSTYYADSDSDGFGDPTSAMDACEPPSGYVQDDQDCDDTDPDVNPDADEVCNGLDDDCDGAADGSDAIDPTSWHPDEDGDGWPAEEGAVSACEQPSGYLEPGETFDCDDADPDVHPGAEELADDGIDQDCDGADATAGHDTGDTGGAAFDTGGETGKGCDGCSSASLPGWWLLALSSLVWRRQSPGAR